MISHSDREGNDCIRKLRCHCIQIMHSDIYSAWFVFLKLILVGALLLLSEAVYLGKIDSSSILWSKICGLYLKEVSIQEGFIIAQKRYVLSAKQQPLKKTLPLLKLSYQIEFTYCFIVNLWVKEIF